MTAEQKERALILYDGVCGLCNRFVQFVLRRDCGDLFQFAALQTQFAGDLLRRHGFSAEQLDTVYLVLNPQTSTEQVLARSDASAGVLQRLGGIWPAAAHLLSWFPRPLREWMYKVVASNRYNIFGRYQTCPVPTEQQRRKFIAF
jgi:predicted DCC family thiol-disulfide oxidoreductase YuxK